MQDIRLVKELPEKERYFEVSDKENMFDVFQRNFDKSIMMYRTVYVGTFSKDIAQKKILSFEDEGLKNDLVGGDLSDVSNSSDIKMSDDEIKFSFEPVNCESVKKIDDEDVKDELISNPLDWSFLGDEKEIEEEGIKYSHVTDSQPLHKKRFKGVL